MAEQETIVGVSIHVYGKIYQLPKPNRHHHVIRMIYDETQKQVPFGGQGFITSTGRHVDREEGLIIATAAGQLLDRHNHPTELFSESVW